MKLAWLTKLPMASFPVRGDGGTTLLPQTFSTSTPESPPVEHHSKRSAVRLSLSHLWEKVFTPIKSLFASEGKLGTSSYQSFMIPEQRQWREQVESYAESPFEKALFYLKRKPNDYVVSKAWAEALRSSEPQTRDAALSLLRAFLAYQDMNGAEILSPHTQMKLLLFSPHLNEGPLGKAILYEALLGLPLAQFLEFKSALSRDFSTFPPVAQVLILKQLIALRKNLDKTASEEEVADLKKLVKALVIEFYSNKQEVLAQVLSKQEKIRLGFLKFQPIEEAYRKELEEIERRYRLKLRQLKKRRIQKVAEAEEERLRRIELIYDVVEGHLMSGLNELDVATGKELAV